MSAVAARDAYLAAVLRHENERTQIEAFGLAWSVRFDTDTLRRYCVATETVFTGRELTSGEQRDLEITRRAVVIADEITDEQLAALAMPPRARRAAA